VGHWLRVRRRRGVGRPQLRPQLAPIGPSVGGAPLRRALLLQLHTGVAPVAHRKREVIRNPSVARCEVLKSSRVCALYFAHYKCVPHACLDGHVFIEVYSDCHR